MNLRKPSGNNIICYNKARNILLFIHINKRKKKSCRVCREHCQSYRHPLQNYNLKLQLNPSNLARTKYI